MAAPGGMNAKGPATGASLVTPTYFTRVPKVGEAVWVDDTGNGGYAHGIVTRPWSGLPGDVFYTGPFVGCPAASETVRTPANCTFYHK